MKYTSMQYFNLGHIVFDPVTTGKRIQKRREELGYHSRERFLDFLAKRFGWFISMQTLGKWERGEGCPTRDNLIRISIALSCPLSELVAYRVRETERERDQPAPYNHFIWTKQTPEPTFKVSSGVCFSTSHRICSEKILFE